jgi:hypothetical protein
MRAWRPFRNFVTSKPESLKAPARLAPKTPLKRRQTNFPRLGRGNLATQSSLAQSGEAHGITGGADESIVIFD